MNRSLVIVCLLATGCYPTTGTLVPNTSIVSDDDDTTDDDDTIPPPSNDDDIVGDDDDTVDDDDTISPPNDDDDTVGDDDDAADDDDTIPPPSDDDDTVGDDDDSVIGDDDDTTPPPSDDDDLTPGDDDDTIADDDDSCDDDDDSATEGPGSDDDDSAGEDSTQILLDWMNTNNCSEEQYNFYSYFFCNIMFNPVNFEDACDAVGLDPVAVNDTAENVFLETIVCLIDTCPTSNGIDQHHWWIGLTDEGSEGTFYWMNGDPVSYTNWHFGPPSWPNTNANWTTLMRWGNGQWNNDAGTHIGFICEEPINWEFLD